MIFLQNDLIEIWFNRYLHGLGMIEADFVPKSSWTTSWEMVTIHLWTVVNFACDWKSLFLQEEKFSFVNGCEVCRQSEDTKLCAMITVHLRIVVSFVGVHRIFFVALCLRVGMRNHRPVNKVTIYLRLPFHILFHFYCLSAMRCEF